VSDEMYTKAVGEKTKVIETKLADLSDAKNNISLFGVLIGMLSVILALVFVNHGFNLKWLIVLVMLLGYLLFYRFSMKSAEAKSKALENFGDEEDINSNFYSKANYLSSMISLRKTRLNLTRYFYIFFFPLFLVLLKISRSAEGLGSPLKAILLAVGIGSIFWYFYFKDELLELEMTKEDLEEIKNKFASST